MRDVMGGGDKKFLRLTTHGMSNEDLLLQFKLLINFDFGRFLFRSDLYRSCPTVASGLWAPRERRQDQRRPKGGVLPCLAGRRLGDKCRRATARRRSASREELCPQVPTLEEIVSPHQSLYR